jgi:hypothetical protein
VHDCVADAVNIKLSKDKEEKEEIRKRRANIIIHVLREPIDGDAEERQKQDESEITDLLHVMKCDTISVSNLCRLGRRNGDLDAKPRPILLTVASENQKDTILRSTKNLKGRKEKGLDRVYVNQDLTPTQREKRKLLVQELKERQSNGERNLIIINNEKIVTRRMWSEETE